MYTDADNECPCCSEPLDAGEELIQCESCGCEICDGCECFGLCPECNEGLGDEDLPW